MYIGLLIVILGLRKPNDLYKLNDIYFNMNSALEEAKKDFELFHNDYEKYKEKVDNLSALFKLKNKAKLRSDYLPTYFVGNFEDKNYKYVLFGINPGYSEKQNPKEETWKKSSWEDYLNFVKNFFILFKNNGMKSPYYKRLSKLFSGLDNIELKDYSEVYDYYQKHIINIELIPYHSTCFGISNHLTEQQKFYFKRRFESDLNFLKNLNIKLMLFNGNPFFLLLIKNNLIQYDKKINLNKYVNMYTFRVQDIPCVLFDKFLTQAGFGLTYEDMKNKIPNLLRAEFKDI